MLALIWAGVILLCLMFYIIFDGYDLGIGILSMFEKDKARKKEMLETVASNWDGNETWLVLLGVSLFAGFPLAFGIVLPYLYIPLICMLFALIVRGVSIELVSNEFHSKLWMRLFGIGSLVAALAQGIAIGAVMQVAAFEGARYTGGVFDFFSVVSVTSAVTLVFVYVALGFGYLQHRHLSMQAESSALELGGLMKRGKLGIILAGIAAVLMAFILQPWSLLAEATLVRTLAFWALLVASIGAFAVTAATFNRKRPGVPTFHERYLPFMGVVVAVVAFLLAFTVARYPQILPNLTLAQTVSPDISVNFLIIGIAILNIPLVLFYNWFSHRVFSGSVGKRSGGPVPDVVGGAYNSLVEAGSQKQVLREPETAAHRLYRYLTNFLLGLICFVLYFACINLFGLNEMWHIATWAVVALLSLFSLGVWIMDEKRHGDDA